MSKLIFLLLMGCSCTALAQSADIGKLPKGAHIESVGADDWLVIANGRRLPWNTGAAADISYNPKHCPKYPVEAYCQHQGGVVVVMVLIGLSGEVKDVKVERSSGLS